MPNFDIDQLSITSAGALFRSGDLSPLELTAHHLSRIEHVNPSINAFVTVTADQALAAARTATEELAGGRDRGPLHGIPISLKDNIDTAGIRTTAGCLHFADRVPEQDATVVRRLHEVGAVLLGKVNLHELAIRCTTDNPVFGQTRNPWDLDRVPGGSSGGSAAALAAGLGLASVGNDTGGSIRIPASLCGVVGLKPTYGRVSGAGVMPDWPTYACVGPLARGAEDCALMLQTMAGYDAGDFASVRTGVHDYTTQLRAGVRGLHVGVPRAHFFDCPDEEIRAAVDLALDTLGALGAEVRDVEVSGLDDGFEGAPLLFEMAEFYREAVVAQPEHFSPRALVSLTWGLGRTTLAEHFQARRAVNRVTEALRRTLEEVDVLITPTTPLPAPLIGATFVPYGARSLEVSRALTQYTRTFNFTGLPAASTPCGFTTEGLPIGLQCVGRSFDEALVLRVAHAYEQATEWSQRRPPMLG